MVNGKWYVAPRLVYIHDAQNETGDSRMPIKSDENIPPTPHSAMPTPNGPLTPRGLGSGTDRTPPAPRAE